MSMPRIATLDEIKSVLPKIDLLSEMESAFIAYSRGDCVIPPVGELIIDEKPPGEVHIKYGYARGGGHYVVKIASGFPMNRDINLPTGNGLMLLFDLRTGELSSVLLDECFLTEARTAAAGALASRALAPSTVERIGIIGTGMQAHLQLEYGARALACTEAMVWGRTPDHVARFEADFSQSELSVRAAKDVQELVQTCQVIVTCTPATEPLFQADWIGPGTQITAIGSDTPEKQELDVALLARADRVVVDSLDQGRVRGEVAQGLRAGVITESDVIELGAVLDDPGKGRTSDEEITIADLSGVAIQDLQIAEAVTRCLGST